MRTMLIKFCVVIYLISFLTSCSTVNSDGTLNTMTGEPASASIPPPVESTTVESPSFEPAINTSAQTETHNDLITLIGPNGEECPLSLNMPMDEVKSRLNKAHINRKGQFSEYSIHNMDYSINFRFGYNKNGEKIWKLNSVVIYTPYVKTHKGLKIGDSEDLIEKLHGECPNIINDPVESNTYYTYDMESYLLRISVGYDKTIFDWQMIAKRTDGIVLIPAKQDESRKPVEFILKAKDKEDIRFYLGMTRDEAVSLLETAKMEYDDNIFDNGTSRITYDDILLNFKTDDSNKNILDSINIFTDLYTTSKGLKVGDSEEKALSLYPNSSTYMYAEGSQVYECDMNGYFFNILVRPYNKTVYGWSLTTSQTVNG